MIVTYNSIFAIKFINTKRKTYELFYIKTKDLRNKPIFSEIINFRNKSFMFLSKNGNKNKRQTLFAFNSQIKTKD